MRRADFRNACVVASKRMEAYFSKFLDCTGTRQSYATTMNRLVKRTPFNSDVVSKMKEARELHKRMGHHTFG